MGPLVFNIYTCNLFLENNDIDIANYVDGNTLCACSSDLDSVTFKFQKNAENFFRWFHNNNVISNAEKSHLFVHSKKNLEIQVSSCSIRNELLVIHINDNLNFDYHVNQLCKKASKKLRALTKIAK